MTAEISITLFVLSVTFGLYALPFFKEKLANNEFVNIILRRSCWVIATYLMILNSAIMATIADSANLSLKNEMYRFMWFFGMAGYLFMGFLTLSTFITLLKMWQVNKRNKRMGDHHLT